MSKLLPVLLLFSLLSCSNKGVSESTPVVEVKKNTSPVPLFNGDSAYLYVANQVHFGPRTPNSEAHKQCGNYLIAELERFGAKMYVQEMILTAYDNTKLQSRNIIGSYNPASKKRILLFAHWDTRPYSDQDPNPSNHRKPIDGADDGASGIGVLLEIARQLNQKAPETGVDIIFFDAEDYGTPDFITNNHTPDTYCLGSQFWAKNPHVPNYTANFGILLDMVGGKNATFLKEGISRRMAAPIVEKVWSTARNLGYGKYFLNTDGGAITDDHQYVIGGRGIPCIDIINLNPETSGFAPYWHTQNDTMQNIDKETLKAVGQTVLDVVYNP